MQIHGSNLKLVGDFNKQIVTTLVLGDGVLLISYYWSHIIIHFM